MFTLYTVSGTSVGSGVQYSLGDGGYIFVSVNAVVGNTDVHGQNTQNDSAIVGMSFDHRLMINGEVSATGDAIQIITDQTGGDEVTIGATGTVYSVAYHAINIDGPDSLVRNGGALVGANGVEMDGNGIGTQSRVINTGTITADTYAVSHSGSENFLLLNSGTITGDANALLASSATGVVTVDNDGVINGLVQLGSGNDIYDGSNGIANGLISGGLGNDTLTGGAKAEEMEGDGGRDILTGGGGADEFYYLSTGDSTLAKAGRDLITDFSETDHDRIDLSAIDAKSSTAGTDEAFHFIGTTAFDGQEGELRYQFLKHGHTLISADVDGDKHADFAVELSTHVALVKGDFIL